MPHYHYLIIGGGMAAAAAVRGIRKLDAEGSIGLISEERHPPYKRPLLSKGLWAGKPLEKAWMPLQEQSLELLLGRTACALDPQGKSVTDDQGARYTFDKLLLAMGGAPRRLPGDADGVIYLRSLDDYQRLRELAQQGQRFAVIGGGFIGSEIAAALAMNEKQVTMIFPEQGIGQATFGQELAEFLNGYYRQKGVEVVPAQLVSAVRRRGSQYLLATSAGREIRVDGIVAGLGLSPNIELARSAGLAVNNGVVVDELLRTSHPDIYAAGDVAEFYSSLLAQRLRVEHEDNALTMGRLAGQAMAGAARPYTHQPFFYSDLFDLGYEAVGVLDSRLELVADWAEPFKQGVLYYLRDGRLRGVLLWNVWGQVDAARELLAESRPLSANDLRGRLPA